MNAKDNALRMAIELISKCDIHAGNLLDITNTLNACKDALSEPVTLPKIDYDADMDRYYIPMPAGWEMQTKGKGSSFRLCNTKTHERAHVLDERLQPVLEQMAREMHEASTTVTLPDVAIALEERDKLGFAVVEVIGKLDEINEQVEEITLHDVNYFAIPAELWHELQDSLEQMPQRADLFTQHKVTLPDGWVSVEDRLPEFEHVKHRRVRVLVTWKETDAVFTLWYGHRFGYNSPSFFEEYEWTESDLGFIDENDNPFLGETLTYSAITHWQPLPAAPTCEKEKG